MSESTTRVKRRKVHPPAVCCEPHLIRAPIYPCTLVPEGKAGILIIGEKVYAITPVAELPPEGDVLVRGYSLLQSDGKRYDVSLAAPVETCDCPDGTFREREGGCRHVRALRELRAANKIA
jgi:hypothetical protein